jgi:effector-binding domain-containing protein
MRFGLPLACVATILCGITGVIHGDDKPAAGAPAAPAAANSGVTIGEMRIQDVPAMTFLYLPLDEITFARMGDPIKQGFDKIFGSAVEAKLLIARPTMLVYQGNPHFDPQKSFKMEYGIVVGDDTQPIGDCKVRKTEPFRCATILYTGPVDQQGKAYEKLIPALKAAGHTPTGEEREMCLYWEGLDSSNNVFIMQIGIK